MSWKFVLNGNAFENSVEASMAARDAGYNFFLHDGIVYFRDNISLHFFNTGLIEKDLIG